MSTIRYRQRKGQQNSLTPCHIHYYMCGAMPAHIAPVRLPGGFELLIQMQSDPDGVERAWRTHRTALMAEAQAAGFTPVAEAFFDGGGCLLGGDDIPTDVNPARDAWSQRFCAEHKY